MPEYPPEDSFQFDRANWHGVPMFTCQVCQINIFHYEAQMLEHCRKMDHGRVRNGNLTIEQFIEREDASLYAGVIITLGYICWNTKEASVEGALALAEEAIRLRQLGIEAKVIILDNGSRDGTAEALNVALGHNTNCIILSRDENQGISKGRNIIIDVARTFNPTYHLMLDGDIEVVPLSVYQMMRYLECHKDYGCIGAYSSNYSKERDHVAKNLYEIPEGRVKGDIKIAWTQYGLFRAIMFEQGIRFDESGPFGEPGWGFEDDDFFYQMIMQGWESKYFGGMCYLHRNIRSSWPNLRAEGVDIDSMFKKRKEYLINKWRKCEPNSAILQGVAGQHPPKES